MLVLMLWIHKYFSGLWHCHISNMSPALGARMLVYRKGSRVLRGVWSGSGTRRSHWFTICLWDWADVRAERPISVCFQVHFLFHLHCFECDCSCICVCVPQCVCVCVQQCSCMWHFTLWLTQVPAGLIVLHVGWVNAEQVSVLMKACLVSSTYTIGMKEKKIDKRVTLHSTWVKVKGLSSIQAKK